MEIQRETNFQPIKPSLGLGTILVAVVGTVGSIVTIYLALKVWTLPYTLLALSSVIIPTLLIVVLKLWGQLKQSSRQHNHLLREHENIKNYHQALSAQFDKKIKVIENNKEFREYIKRYLTAAIAAPTEEEKQQLLRLVDLIASLESQINGDD